MRPATQNKLVSEIRKLERRLRGLRRRLKVSDRNEVICLYDGGVDERILVEAMAWNAAALAFWRANGFGDRYIGLQAPPPNGIPPS